MGMPGRLHSKETNLNGGEYIMNLRVLLTDIGDKMIKMGNKKQQDDISKKPKNSLIPS